MSHTNSAETGMPNGVPPQMVPGIKPNLISQERQQLQYNGMNSSNSSRNVSPAPRTIPASQLPPSRNNIPLTQLPPSPITTVTQKLGQLNVSPQVTPNISPNKFSTSTPNAPAVNLQNPTGFSQNSAFSPITSTVPKNRTVTPVLENVPLTNSDTNTSSQIISSHNQISTQNQTSVQQKPLSQHFSQTSVPQNALPGSMSISQQSHQYSSAAPNFQQQFIRPQNSFVTQPSISSNSSIFTQNSNLNRPTLGTYNNVNSNIMQNRNNSPANGPQSMPTMQNSMPPVQNNRPPLQNNMPPMQSSRPQMQNIMPQMQNSMSILQKSMPQMQNSMPQMQNSMPQMQNSMPQTQSSMHPMYNSMPPMKNNMPQMATSQSVQSNMPPMPNRPQFHNNTPSNIHQMQTGVPPTQNNMPPIQNSMPNMPPIENSLPRPPIPNTFPQTQNTQMQSMAQTQNKMPPMPQNVAPKSNVHGNRYPAANMPEPYQQNKLNQQPNYNAPQSNYIQQQSQYQQQQQSYTNQQQSGVAQLGFSKFWGQENIDLLQNTNILPPTKVDAPNVSLGQEMLDAANCSPEVFRCTMTKIPESNNLLQKSRLPLGVLIHPFKDLNHLPVIQCSVIVRCRTCRTYINPFVYFVDSKRWKCNLCYRINELPEEFQYDPVSKSYGDPSRRPEIKSSTIEYIAPAEYMLRPPQPAIYLFLLDISRLAVESGYLHSVCNILLEEINNLPGDARTKVGFLAYDSALHFFSLGDGLSRPHEMIVLDLDEVFLPCPDNFLVNLKDRVELISDLLGQLPNKYNNTYDSNSALGAALEVAYKMMSATGGRVTVFQASLPNIGPGALTSREDPNQRASAEVAHLNPANDFYKRLALECSGQQIAVDLFLVNSQYVDLATVSGISRFSGGCIHHFPLFKAEKTLHADAFDKCFRRYLTRKIGFEAVMRIRCTRGLSIHTFHGNFFVRSTDLLSLPNINPDAGFGMQVAIEENLSDVQSVCFQVALLYTSSKGERRIRVHTLCLPVCSTLHDVLHSADQQCIVGLLSKMAVDRSMQSSLSDAREAFINVAIDILSSYKMSLNMGNGQSGLLAPQCLKLLPLYISALLKHIAFRVGSSTRLDDRVKAMIDMKAKPLCMLLQQIYPDLYPIHNLEMQQVVLNSEEEPISMPPRLQLSARCLENNGAFLMDTGELMIILICPNVSPVFLNDVLGVSDYHSIRDDMYEIPVLNNLNNQRLHNFINYLNDDKPYVATIQILRDNSPNRMMFLEKLIEDRMENALSYHEFLQHLRSQVK